MPLINGKINLRLTWSANCVITASVGAGTSALPDTKRCVPVVTLSTEHNGKLLKQLDSGFIPCINP